MISELKYRPLDEFPLKWRFTDSKYAELSAEHLAQIRPLDAKSSLSLWNYIIDTDLYSEVPFRKDFFQSIESISVPEEERDYEEEDSVIRKWLYRCALPFDKRILMSWQPDLAAETTWKMLVKYWSDFYYPISDDLTVCDESLQWALLFHHEETVYFGTNTPREVNTEQDHSANSLHASRKITNVS